MSWGGWKKIGEAAKSAVSNPAVAMFANPLIAQDVMGSAFAGSMARGADSRNALAASQAAPGSLATGGSAGEWADLAAFNAALLAGGAGGALAAGASIPAGFGASGFGMTAGTSAALGATAGASAYGASSALAQQAKADYATAGGSGGGMAPPDVNEANDPAQAQQFLRIRKAARLLGRGGTIKNKSTSSLGLGDQVLGDQLSLIGS